MTSKNINSSVSKFLVLSEVSAKEESNIIGSAYENENGNLGLSFSLNGSSITELKGLDKVFINVNKLKKPQGKKVGIITMTERKAKKEEIAE
jgi:hypothetical protein